MGLFEAITQPPSPPGCHGLPWSTGPSSLLGLGPQTLQGPAAGAQRGPLTRRRLEAGPQLLLLDLGVLCENPSRKCWHLSSFPRTLVLTDERSISVTHLTRKQACGSRWEPSHWAAKNTMFPSSQEESKSQ